MISINDLFVSEFISTRNKNRMVMCCGYDCSSDGCGCDDTGCDTCSCEDDDDCGCDDTCTYDIS